MLVSFWRIYASLGLSEFTVHPSLGLKIVKNAKSEQISFVYVETLAAGRSECGFEYVIFKLIVVIGIFKSYLNATDFIDDKSTLVQVLAWCWQATNHYLNQCWPSSKCHLATISLSEKRYWIEQIFCWKTGMNISIESAGTSLQIIYKFPRNHVEIEIFNKLSWGWRDI